MTLEEAWTEFSEHAKGCDICSNSADNVRASVGQAGWGREKLFSFLKTCDLGALMVMRWDHYCQIALGRHEPEEGEKPVEQISGIVGQLAMTINRRRERAGLIGMPESDAQRRIEALMNLPDRAYSSLLSIEDAETRESSIIAVERSYFRTKANREPKSIASDTPECTVCGKPLKPKDIEKGHDRHYKCWLRVVQ